MHRVDMRLRLGLLQDPAAIEKQLQRDAAEEAARKAKAEIPTVKTKARTEADEAAAKAREKEKDKPKPKGPHIRPLSEAKAIDSGASFISESFLFSVAAGLILFETWRSRRKEQNRRNDVAEKLAELEARDEEKERVLLALEQELDDMRTQKDSRSTQGLIQATKRPHKAPKQSAEAIEAPPASSWRSLLAKWLSPSPTKAEKGVQVADGEK